MCNTKIFLTTSDSHLLALVALIAFLSIGVDMKAQAAPPEVDHDNSRPSAKDGTVRAGVGGVSTPACVSCPPPKYSSEARAAKLQGTVVLQATITVDGRAINISVVKALGKGLEEKAIEAVKNWKFKPASGPDGKPVPCVVPIEVSFRLHS
jgi:TonB family protein